MAVAREAVTGQGASREESILLKGYAFQTYFGMGNDYLLVPIAAVIIGGTNIMGGAGGYAGTIAGALIAVLPQSILSVAHRPGWQEHRLRRHHPRPGAALRPARPAEGLTVTSR